MKKLVLVFAMFIGALTFANNEPVNEKSSELRAEIIKLLGNASFLVNEKVVSTVEFMVNKKGEVIVLTVHSNNALVDSYVKSKLNYQLIKVKNNVAGKVFKMPLTIVNK